MRFPITDLLDQTDCESWLLDHFHPDGLTCPQCGAAVSEAHLFRRTKKSRLQVYRCNQCLCAYNLYTNTVFQQRHLTPQQVVLLLRGVLKGETSAEIAEELGVSDQTVLEIRRDIQANAAYLQPDTPLPDQVTESDELFVNAGEKRRSTR
jgi:transposase-like protein